MSLKRGIKAKACLWVMLLAFSAVAMAVQADDTIRISAPQIKNLGIKLAAVESARPISMVTVPAMIEPPIDARVAVAAPFQGIVRTVFVVPGQAVTKGQKLAQIMSRDVLSTGADLASAQAQLTLARSRAQRMHKLANVGVIAQSRVEEAQAALTQASAMAHQNQRLLTLAHADGTTGLYELIAPINGKVSSMHAATGMPLDGAQAPFVIDATDRYALTAQLPQQYAGRVHPGMFIQVQPNVQAIITTVASTVNPQTRSLAIKASVPASAGILAGTALSVQVLANPPQGAVQVPASALTRYDDSWHVYERMGESFKPRKVQVFARDDKHAVLSDGVELGVSVATSGVTEIKSKAQDKSKAKDK